MNSVLLLLLILLLGTRSARELDCKHYYNYFDGQDFSLKLLRNDTTSKNCTLSSNDIGGLQMPTVRIKAIGVSGSNSIRIEQWSNLGGVQYPVTIDSLNFEEMVVELQPAYFKFEFNFVENTENDFFHIEVTFRNATPNHSNPPIDYFYPNTRIVDSIDLPPNVIFYPSTATNLQIVLFNESFDLSVLKKFFLYTNSKTLYFEGNLYDLWMMGKLGKGLDVLDIGILNTNPIPIYGEFAVLLGYFKNDSPSFTLPLKSGIETLSSPTGTRIFLEVTDPHTDLETPLIYQNISLNGSGTVEIYAGCVTQFNEVNLIANVSYRNQLNIENMSTYGRCKTYVVKDVEVEWGRLRSSDSSKTAQQGVLMSTRYPYEEVSNYTSTHVINAPKGTKTLSVTYEKVGGSEDVVIEVNGNTHVLGSLESTVTSGPQQIVSFNVTAGRQGDLIRYNVSSLGTGGSLYCSIVVLIVSLLGFS